MNRIMNQCRMNAGMRTKSKSKSRPKKSEIWKIIYTNARGIQGKKSSLIDIVEEMKPKMVLIAETQMRTNKGIEIDGFTYFGRIREEKNGGGVCAFVNNELKNIASPHYSERKIEILWISIKTTSVPIYFGIYYGKQESRSNRVEIVNEMQMLKEEIMEVQTEGEVLLLLDGNARIGLLGEPLTRNGKMIREVFEQTDLQVLNASDKCEGKITRQNTKNPEEKSAIDYAVASRSVENAVCSMKIDENGFFRLKGVKDSDHNSILVEIDMKNLERQKVQKVVRWRLQAPEENWKAYESRLRCLPSLTNDLLQQPQNDATSKYKKWIGEVEKVAIETIGKTTIKRTSNTKMSREVVKLRGERRKIKNEYEKAMASEKQELKEKYMEKQLLVRNQIEREQRKKTEKRIEKMIEGGPNAFWKERRRAIRDDSGEWWTTKDENGVRLYGEEENMENMAKYYEKLYMMPSVRHHTHHEHIVQKVLMYALNRDHEDALFNREPTIDEVETAISRKQAGKATTDLKYEFIKNGGKNMAESILLWIRYYWRSESIPNQWKEGLISNIWKNKGDREVMANQRGITVSSSVGMIIEDIIHGRVQAIVGFTQAQAGGRKDCSTYDHLFCIRAIIDIALKERRKILITFFDVKKAYDHADINDMMEILWENGVKGKLWRLVKNMNEKLSARVKTRYGLTRLIEREMGGRQGGSLIVTMFSKLMDTQAEDMETNERTKIKINNMNIGSFLFVDDVATVAEGYEQQEATLDAVDEFAKKHKLEWGTDKCNVMEVGKHKNVKETWKLGEQEINHAHVYKYLGDLVCRNGKNTTNIDARVSKLKQSTMAIITCSKNEVMKRISAGQLVKLHKTINVASLLYNCESWVLNKTECLKLERAELWALKQILHLPMTTPSVAIRFITGTLYTGISSSVKQLNYLHKVLCHEESHWTLHLLRTLDEKQYGWAGMIREKLAAYGLEEDWDVIKKKTKAHWKRDVKMAAKLKQRSTLLEECHASGNGARKEKTKTKSIIYELENDNNVTDDLNPVMKLDRKFAKCIIMSRYGMLKCGKNFKTGLGSDVCLECGVTDDESHCINHCKKWKNVNGYNREEKIDFEMVYSGDIEKLKTISSEIMKMWMIEYGKNEIRTEI